MKERVEEIPEVVDNLRRVFQAVNQFSRSAAKHSDLTGPQLWLLSVLFHAAPQRVCELARHMYLRPATVVGILNRLEEKGLVNRTRSQLDRRVVHVDLSGAGRELAAEAPEVAQVMLVKGLETLSDGQFACVVEGMRQLVHILGAQELVPQPLHA